MKSGGFHVKSKDLLQGIVTLCLKILFIPDLHVEILECSGNPCMNRATCEDLINTYKCTCPPGYTGTHCQTGQLLIILFKLDDVGLEDFFQGE